MDISLKCPFVAQVCGPTQSGKSEFVGRLIKHYRDVLELPISHVEWYSPHGNLPSSLRKSLKKLPIHVKKRLPWQEVKEKANVDGITDSSEEEEEEERCMKRKQHYLIVIDDFAQESKNSNLLTEYFTRDSHHCNFSVIQITQNVFWRSTDARTRTLNVHYLVLMRQSRDVQQIRLLSRQISHGEGDSKAFMDAYREATRQRPYSYLLVSFHPRDERALMLRTNILPSEVPAHVVYTLPSEKRTYRRMIKEGKGIKEGASPDSE